MSGESRNLKLTSFKKIFLQASTLMTMWTTEGMRI